MKVTKVQQNVIDKMATGWELGCSHFWGRRCWLQKGGVGEGGQSEDIKYSTLSALFKKGMIKQAGRRNHIMTFQLV